MEYDYYIIKQLEIKSIDDNDIEQIDIIELNSNRGYFDELIDNDDNNDIDYYSGNDNKYKRYIQVIRKLCVLFNNNKWKNKQIKEKYNDLIIQEIGDDKLLLSVIKTEVKYLKYLR